MNALLLASDAWLTLPTHTRACTHTHTSGTCLQHVVCCMRTQFACLRCMACPLSIHAPSRANTPISCLHLQLLQQRPVSVTCVCLQASPQTRNDWMARHARIASVMQCACEHAPQVCKYFRWVDCQHELHGLPSSLLAHSRLLACMHTRSADLRAAADCHQPLSSWPSLHTRARTHSRMHACTHAHALCMPERNSRLPPSAFIMALGLESGSGAALSAFTHAWLA